MWEAVVGDNADFAVCHFQLIHFTISYPICVVALLLCLLGNKKGND